jgi:ribonuclease HI
MKITMYTDGSSRGNPGPGGWGAIIITQEEVIELGGREGMTTNNRMELLGTIEGLKHISAKHDVTSSYSIEICTDSEYVRKGMTEWIHGWVKKGWKTSTKKDVLNKDLWGSLLHEETRLKSSGVSIQWTHVRGHAGDKGNERADTIATGCADNAIHLQLYRGERASYPYL